jgi:hypothetical protein
MVENVALFVTSVALLVTPFLAYGLLWGLGHLFVSGGGSKPERVVPSTQNRPSRVIPGTRSEETD